MSNLTVSEQEDIQCFVQKWLGRTDINLETASWIGEMGDELAGGAMLTGRRPSSRAQLLCAYLVFASAYLGCFGEAAFYRDLLVLMTGRATWSEQ